MDARATTNQLYQFKSGDSIALFFSDHTYQMWDWKLNAHFTRLVKKKIISGKYEEVTLCPILWNEKQLNFYVIGMGDLSEPDSKLKSLAKKLGGRNV